MGCGGVLTRAWLGARLAGKAWTPSQTITLTDEVHLPSDLLLAEPPSLL